MKYESCDHPPFWPDGPWDTTLREWEKQGMPKDVSLEAYFGLEPLKIVYAGLNTGMYPEFERKIIEETDDMVISIDQYGRTIRDFKNQTTMPEWLEFPVKTADDLRRVIDERFNPDRLAERWQADWDSKTEAWRRMPEQREELLFVDGGCYYGHLRNLCGVEVSSYLFYDAPELVDELFEKMHFFCFEGIRRIKTASLQVDYLGFGEDIGAKNGPLISPAMFKKFLYTRYKQAVEEARSAGIELVWYDSDGNLIPFIDMYLKAGIDCLWPCEVAAGMDPVGLRKRYGKRLKLMGGLDKREIAKGKNAIRREIDAKRPLIQEGGYIPKIDHSVSSDISLENYKYYISVLKEIYGIT